MSSRRYNMEITDPIYTDPRFLEVARELRRLMKRETPPPDAEASSDEVSQRVQAKITLRMKTMKQQKPKS